MTDRTTHHYTITGPGGDYRRPLSRDDEDLAMWGGVIFAAVAVALIAWLVMGGGV